MGWRNQNRSSAPELASSVAECAATLIDDYFRQINTLISHASIVHSYSVTYDKRSTSVGFIRGSVYFIDGSMLHLREFVNVQHDVERYMYAYHFSDRMGPLFFATTTRLTFQLDLLSRITNMRAASPTLCRSTHLPSREFWPRSRI
jgi:hypothetical protein